MPAKFKTFDRKLSKVTTQEVEGRTFLLTSVSLPQILHWFESLITSEKFC